MGGAPIPLAKPAFDDRELEAVRRVLESGWVVQGPEVEAFEGDIARRHGARHAIAVSSGTAALHVAYLALGIGPGDAVFIPSFAWPSAANMAALVGARPVFVDVLPDTFSLDPVDLGRRIEELPKTDRSRPRAVVPVHSFGLSADLEAIGDAARASDLLVIEDAACALGASRRGRPVGTFGRLGIFSFHPRKAVTTGEGGAIVTDDDGLAAAVRLWRNHGQIQAGADRDMIVPGLNYRLTEIQAAIGRVQLDRLDGILAERRAIARAYLDALAGCEGLSLPAPHPEHTWQTFMVVLDDGIDRGRVIRDLERHGFGAGPGSIAGHCMTFHRERYGYRPEDLPISARLHRQGLALPLHTHMAAEDGIRCASALAGAIRAQRAMGAEGAA